MICKHCGLSKDLSEDNNGCFCVKEVPTICTHHNWFYLYTYASSNSIPLSHTFMTTVDCYKYELLMNSKKVNYVMCDRCNCVGFMDKQESIKVVYTPEPKV